MIRSKNVCTHIGTFRSYLVALKKILALLQPIWLLSYFGPSGIVSTYFLSCSIKSLKRFDAFAYSILGSWTCTAKRSLQDSGQGGIIWTSFFLPLRLMGLNIESNLAKVAGSNHPPTRSTFVNRVEYGIAISSFSVIVGQIQQQCQCRILPCVRHILRFLQEVWEIG